MIEDEFTKLYKYMDRKFEALDRRFDVIDKKLDFGISSLDASAKRMETYHQEMLALSHQVDRHERWHHQTAKACGIKLSA